MGNPSLIKFRVPLIYLALAVVTFIAFEQVHDNDFTSYDDEVYVIKNSNVNKGLSVASVVWAFTTPHEANWNPITQISHMIDCQLFGLKPGGHHITSVLLHILTVLSLFWVLTKATGVIWPCAFVAAVFAIHPLRVESVAWVAERKDVLSALFWMLTIAAYLRYAKGPRIGRYLLVVVCLCLGLMSKPTGITLPFVLLLLDYWPLKRFSLTDQNPQQLLSQSETGDLYFRKTSLARLFIEKIPLFIIVVIFSVIIYFVHQEYGTLKVTEQLPFNARIANALVSYFRYIHKMIYPANLAVLYPHPGKSLPVSLAVVCGITLAIVTAGIAFVSSNRRYLIVGWLWYLGTLVPVIGLIQTGSHAMADRFTYLPSIGIFIIFAWSMAELLAKWRCPKVIPAVLAGIVLVGLLLCTRMQVRHWRNDLTLFKHAVETTSNNYVMHNNLGAALKEIGKLDQAVNHYQEALRINPDYARAHNNLGLVLKETGKLDQAINHFQQALRIKPDYVKAHNNLGVMLGMKGNVDQAVIHYRRALQIDPLFAKAYYNLGTSFLSQGKNDEAVKYFQKTLQLKPDDAAVHNNLGAALGNMGRIDEAIYHFQQAIAAKPDMAVAYLSLARALEMSGRIDEAISNYQQALKADPQYKQAQQALDRLGKNQ